MNPRIQQLAEEAGADFMRRINYNNLEGKEYEEDAGVIFESNKSFEKFAELIIAECCVALRPMLRDMISRSRGVDLIVEHFRDKE
jgi:hypothetical protein